MRRIVIEEPLSRAAAWSRVAALFALVVAIIGIAMARAGVEPNAAIAVEASAMAIAVIAILFALAGAVVIWRTGYRGTGRLLAGLAIAALVLAYPTYVTVQASRVPPLRDISTDLVDPPSFSKSPQAVAARAGKTPPPLSARDRELEQRFYPDIQPVVLDVEATEAYRTALAIVTARRWTIVEEQVPLGRFGAGRIDAVAKTPIMGFPADVTIRIRPLAGQSRVDIRSVSRTRWQEPGGNASRIEALASDIEDQASDEK